MNYSDTPWLPTTLIAILMLVVLSSQLRAHGYDPSYLISIGDKYVVRPDAVPRGVHIFPDSSGYDGQFYYQLALNPFWPQQVNLGLNISNGPYRQQRIVYPLLVWLFSLDNASLVPAMLVFVNYLALCAIAWSGGRFVQIHGRHALAGCLFALFPGFLFTLSRDLTEILVVMFLLMAFVLLRLLHSDLPLALLLTLAVLTRETAVLAIIALGITFIHSRQYVRLPVLGVPLGAYAIWQVALLAKWGQLPLLAGRHNIGAPGSGILTFVSSIDLNNLMHRIWIAELGYVVAVAGVALFVSFHTSQLFLPEKLSWFLYGLLAVLLTHHVWIEDNAFMRALAELYLFSLLLIIPRVRDYLLTCITVGTAATWILVLYTRLSW